MDARMSKAPLAPSTQGASALDVRVPMRYSRDGEPFHALWYYGSMKPSGGEVDQPDRPIDVYVNSARFAVGIYDFMIEFGLQEATTDASKPAGINHLVRMRMSPQHAKVLAVALQDVVAKYEAQVGKIDVPRHIFTQMGIEP